MFDRREKLFVEIIGKNGIKKRKNFPVESGKIIIEKARGRKPGYKVDFNRSCVLNYNLGFGPFKRRKQKVLLVNGASKCVEFKEGKVNIPIWDKKTAEALFNAEVIRNAGNVQTTLTVPIFLYLLIGGIVIMNIFIILLSSGKIRIA